MNTWKIKPLLKILGMNDSFKFPYQNVSRYKLAVLNIKKINKKSSLKNLIEFFKD